MTLSGFASVWAAIAASVAAIQTYIVFRQLKADHERSRRTAASSLMQFYVEQNSVEGMAELASLSFFESLSTAQVERLQKKEAMNVNKSWQKELNTYFERAAVELPPLAGDEVELDEWHVKFLRHKIIHTLNVLETVATAWRHNVADRSIIEEEFRFILTNRNNSLLEGLRIETGAYPSLELLSERLMRKSTRTKGRIV